LRGSKTKGCEIDASASRAALISKSHNLVYPMGSEVRSEPSLALGADHTADGFLNVDQKQRSTVSGLYGIGDVVSHHCISGATEVIFAQWSEAKIRRSSPIRGSTGLPNPRLT
jgi:thioredoxin reductase